MADLSKKNASGNTRLVGADPTTGAETEWMVVSDNNEVRVADILDNGGEDDTLVLTTTPTLMAVGGTNRAGRKILILQADGKFDWGFSNTTQNFVGFKNQYISIEVGPGTDVWAKAQSGTVNISRGEAS